MSYRKLLYGALAIVFAVSLVPYQVKAATSTPPRGWLDSCVVGWALDTNTPDKSIDVHIYVDKPAGVDNNSGYAGVVTTSIVRDDVNTAYHRPQGEKHGFEWSPPKSLYDGKTHKVYVYGIDTTDTSGASNALLDGSPQECSWSGGGTTSGAITVTSPAVGEQWQVGTQHNISWTDIRGSSVGGKYTVQLEPYIACLYAVPVACKIAQPAPYVIAEHLADQSFTWNVPTSLPAIYKSAGRILVTLDNTDVFGRSEVFSVVDSATTTSITITGRSDLNFKVGQSVAEEFHVSGGTNRGFVWHVSSGTLPPGLTFGPPLVFYPCDPLPGQANLCPDNTERQLLSGTPTAPGTYTFVVQVTDGSGKSGTASFTATVTSSTTTTGLTITGPTSLTGTVGQSFSASFTVSGGTAPYQWQQTGGALPDGINIFFPAFNCITTPCVNPYDTAIFRGVPTQVSSPTATFRVTDAAGRTVDKTFTITVTSGNVSCDNLQPCVEVTLAPSTPIARTVPAGASNVELAHIKIANTSQSLAFTPTLLALGQIASDGGNYVSAVRVYDGDTKIGSAVAFSYNTLAMLWSADANLLNYSILAGQIKTLRLVGELSQAAPVGATVKFGLVGVGYNGTAHVNGLPTYGNLITVSSANIKTVRTGYVDVATGQRVEGWAFDSTKAGACVTLTYKRNTTVSDNDRFTQDVCPTITRTDAADWIRKNFGDGYTITQPLGFRADPTQVLQPGSYLLESAKLKDSGVSMDLGESAKFPITIADTSAPTGPIVITSPAKADTWQTGQTKTIAWTGSNNLPVNIRLIGQPCPATQVCPAVLRKQYDVATGVTGSSYSWVIPTNVASGSYRISLETSAAGVDYILWGQSGVFTITGGGVSTSPLQVTSPAANDKVYAGAVKNIVWNVLADSQGLPVTIKYNHTIHPACRDVVPPCGVPDTLEVVTITTTAPNTGTYAWSVPATLSGQYTVTVSVGGVSDDSDTFTVLSQSTPRGLTVTSPTKEDVWHPGETHTIYWTPNVANTKVGLSAALYIACLHATGRMCAVAQPAPVVIEVSAPDTGSYSWTIPKDFHPMGAYTITVTNATSGLSGESDPFQVSGTVSDAPCATILPGQVVVGVSGTVYVITPDCKKYGFTSLQDLTSRGYSLSQVQKVDQAALDAIPTVDFLARPANTSFRYSGQRVVYYLSAAGCKETYPSLVTLRAWGVATADIVTIPTSEQYPDCNPSFVQLPNNSWAQLSGQPTVYHVEGTVLRPYSSLGALISSGFQNSKFFVIRQAEFNLYTVGDPIQ